MTVEHSRPSVGTSASEDTATITAGMLYVDGHIEMARLGSRAEYVQ